jgi:hypothetical protein
MGKTLQRILFSTALYFLIYVSPSNNPDYVFYDSTYNEEVFQYRFEPGYSLLVLAGCKIGVDYSVFYQIIILLQIILINSIFKNFSPKWAFASLPALAFVLPTFGVQTRWGLAVLLLILGIESRYWILALFGMISSIAFHKSAAMYAIIYGAVFWGHKFYLSSKTLLLIFIVLIIGLTFFALPSLDQAIELLGYSDYYGTAEFEGKSLISLIYLVVNFLCFTFILIEKPILLRSWQYLYYGTSVLVALILKDFAVVSGRGLMFAIFYEAVLVNSRDLHLLDRQVQIRFVGFSVFRFVLFQLKAIIDKTR